MEIVTIIAVLAAAAFCALWLRERKRALIAEDCAEVAHAKLTHYPKQASDLRHALANVTAERDALRPLAEIGRAAQAQRKAASDAAAAKRRAAK